MGAAAGERLTAAVTSPEQEGLAAAAIARVRVAQAGWGARGLRERLAVLRNFRRLLAGRSGEFVEGLSHLPRTGAESLSAEVIPLADACLFLEREAARVLRTRKLGRRGRALWVGRTAAEVRREALGVVLIVGPANYPLLLPGVQVVQGLAAGNGVVLKPGRGGAGVAMKMREMLVEAGVPGAVVVVLGEGVEEVRTAVEAGVEKVFLTGGVEAGRAVLGMLAERCVPAVMELSGCDAVVVLGSADLDRAAAAVRFGRGLNGGQTCIAPRRIFAAEEVAGKLRRRLGEESELKIVPVRRGEDVAALVNGCAYKLGATIFGEEGEARALAARLEVGVVVINDMIVPTADGRLPFGGRGLSGFGVTRGAEGLLEMTAVKTVIVRRGAFLPHLEKGDAGTDAEMFRGYLAGAHGEAVGERVRGVIHFLRCAMARGRRKTKE